MSLEFYYRAADGNLVGPVTQLDDTRIRLYTLDVTQNAEEGSVASSEVTVDDPDGDFDIVGHRVFAVKETEVSASSNTFIYVGYTTERRITRGNHRTLAGADWTVGLVDVNTLLDRRVMVGADCNRPAETDVQRMQWLMSTAEAALITDTRYLSTASPVAMDAVDYRGQMFAGIVDDCAQQSGKNYYLTYFGDNATATQPWGKVSQWYGLDTLAVYDSTIRLSNDLSDVDNVTTFGVSNESTVLTRDPSRVYSGVYMPYDGGAVYVQQASTYNTFARRDAISPAENVKTSAKAQARGYRYLTDIDTEEDIVKTAFQVPAAYVNHLREGMRVEGKFSHLPGYEGFRWLRVLNRNIKQDSELTYTIAIEASAEPDPATQPALMHLYQPGKTAVPSEVKFATTGDAPGAGCATVPTVGPLSAAGTAPNYTGITVGTDGTIDFRFKTSVIMVCADETIQAVFTVRRSGVIVGTTAGPSQVFGPFPGNYVSEETVTGSTEVTAGDLIDARVTLTSTRRGVVLASALPHAVGSCTFYLSVTGTLAV